MEIDKLVPMTSFILEHPASHDYEWQLKNHYNYASFLRQPLTLEMFIGEEALFEGFKLLHIEGCDNAITDSLQILFNKYNNSAELFYNPESTLPRFTGKITSIEDIVKCDLTLTPKAKQIIYGSNR